VLNNSNNIILSKTWLLVIISIFVAVLFAITSFTNPIRPSHSLIVDVEYLVDTNKQYSITSILSTSNNIWQQHSQDSNTLDMFNKLLWFRFTLDSLDPKQPRLLEIDNALLDRVNLWFVRGNEILNEYQIGDSLPFSQRVIEHESFLSPVPTKSQEIVVYVSTLSKGLNHLPLNIWQQQDYLKFTSKSNLIAGVFFGLMLTMGFISLFFFVTTRNATFLVYAGYVMFLALTLAALQGLGYRYIWPNSTWLQQNAIGIFAHLTVWFSIIFCDLLLNVRVYSVKFSKLLNVIAYAFLINLVISLFIPLPLFFNIFLIMLCTSSIFIFNVSVRLWIKGSLIARYYTLALAILFISACVISVDTLNVIDLNLSSNYTLMLNMSVETILLGLILGISHHQQRQVYLDTQAELLNKERQAQHNQIDMLALQENTTEELEYKVQERTLELEIALRELSETNRELQEKNTIDALTGIRNRSYFNKKYQAEVRKSRRERTQLSVVMIDIDHFKSVNDQYGHLIGDECIKAVARTFKNALKRPSDNVCRYGGEEFVLILPSTDLKGALILVEQLRVKIEKTNIHTDDVTINITISAGIGTAIADITQPEDNILALADKQLYAAKNAGRNNVQGSHIDFIQQQD
jgi:diguanylate cyclase (GGDEF)-like protein